MSLSESNPCELVALAASIAIALSKEFSNEELMILAAFFTVLGDNIALLTS